MLSDKRKYIPVKWRFSLDKYPQYASTTRLVAGDLIYLASGNDYSIRQFVSLGNTIEYKAPKDWTVVDVIEINDRGSRINEVKPKFFKMKRRVNSSFYIVIEKCCSSELATSCMPTLSSVSIAADTTTVDIPAGYTDENDTLVFWNEAPVFVGQTLVSFGGGTVVFNADFAPMAGDKVSFWKRCGTIATDIAGADSMTIQAPAGYENALIYVNEQPRLIGISIASITNGLVTFSTENGLIAGDIITFKL